MVTTGLGVGVGVGIGVELTTVKLIVKEVPAAPAPST